MAQLGIWRVAQAAAIGIGLASGGAALAENHAENAVSTRTVLAKSGDVEITLGHVIAAMTSLSEQQLQIPPQQLFEGLLQRLIQQAAVAQTAESISELTEKQAENERRSLIASKVVEEIAAEIEVTPEQLRASYDRRFADFTPDTEYNAAHILVETEEEALAIIAELEGGADFAATAQEKSTGPSGPNGGDLGWFGKGRMVPAFEAAVVDLKIGAISAPVETQFGWHVIKLNDSRIPSVPSFEELEADLTAEVTREIFNARVTDLLDSVPTERMSVTGIDPMVLFDPTILSAPNE